ncbi:MAG: hypothetical protein HQL50_07080 [Magnetococcales bacterium]|nr:hypothetical protein [Magnetococcales bacterium]
MADSVKCNVCGELKPKGKIKCPHCGENDSPLYTMMLVFGGAVIFFGWETLASNGWILDWIYQWFD